MPARAANVTQTQTRVALLRAGPSCTTFSHGRYGFPAPLPAAAAEAALTQDLEHQRQYQKLSRVMICHDCGRQHSQFDTGALEALAPDSICKQIYMMCNLERKHCSATILPPQPTHTGLGDMLKVIEAKDSGPSSIRWHSGKPRRADPPSPARS